MEPDAPLPEPDLPDPEPTDTELTVTFRPDTGANPVVRVLRDPAVDGDRGDHPHPDAALAALAALSDPFAPVPPNTPSTTIYGGPQIATVTGTWRGIPVDATFTKSGGAEMHRWELVGPLLDIGEYPNA